MAIPLIKEDSELFKETGFHEKCLFCDKPTNMWHENTNNPVCPICAKLHKVSELPDHGKNIRKNKRAKKMPTLKREDDISPRRLSTIIEKVRTHLIAKEEENGLYENFGQDELSLLRSNFINISSYSNDMNKKRELLDSFNNWCMSYQSTTNRH